ncbi:EthD domain-containing protein [Mycolicibacterium mengxianglii]|uniref:EthD domain-containing protein n=1 Tax=Mycolicibacterium mengxianglii TaxID=2736649 RepID=UPI0018D195EA|nr:EthD domain-containing protein [Mycolicibacterium mengxianglii]
MPGDQTRHDLTRLVPVVRRAGLDHSLFTQYWADVHGPMCAAIPGIDLYRQFHLDSPRSHDWITAPSVDTTVPDDERIDGAAQCAFVNREDFDRWLTGTAVLADDERNGFDGTYGYYALGATGHLGADAPHAVGGTSMLVLIRRRAHADTGAFRSFIRDTLMTTLLGSGFVSNVSGHLLEPYEEHESHWQADALDNRVPAELQHHAALHVSCENMLAWRRLLDTDQFGSTAVLQSELFSAVHVYPVRSAITFVHDGAITLEGRRGRSTAELIRRIGAVNAE